MRLFGYYALHTLKNQIRKLFKTWVFIFILVCALLGGGLGFGAAKLGDMAEESGAEESSPEEEQILLEAELSLPSGGSLDRMELVELIAGGVLLAVLVFDVLGADKNGSRIFLPADVNLLFPSPMKPQSVLMFRLATQLGAAVFASVYILFQLPNMIGGLGLSPWAALSAAGAWCLTIVAGRLLQVLLYTLCSARPGLKAGLRRGVYGFLLLLAAAYVLFQRRSGLGYLAAAAAFFNAPATRYIPLWGWLKGLVVFAAEGRLAGFLLCLGALLLGGVLLAWIIWHIKADFYEDAMAKSEETAELLERAAIDASGGVAIKRRKKDRSGRIRRDGMDRGWGASVFFHKTLYNRFRFAHLGFFTKTGETYLAAAVLGALACRYVFNTRQLLPVGLLLAGLAFFRALGNPLEQDTKTAWFLLIPETCRKKLFFSLMGGTVCCALDAAPALILAALILWTNPLPALAWTAFVVSMDFYSTCVGTFIDLSVPVAAGKMIKQMVQILFIYFGLVPDGILLAIGLVMHHGALAAVIAAAINTALGFLFFWFSPLFLEPGGGKAASFGVRYAEVSDKDGGA